MILSQFVIVFAAAAIIIKVFSHEPALIHIIPLTYTIFALTAFWWCLSFCIIRVGSIFNTGALYIVAVYLNHAGFIGIGWGGLNFCICFVEKCSEVKKRILLLTSSIPAVALLLVLLLNPLHQGFFTIESGVIEYSLIYQAIILFFHIMYCGACLVLVTKKVKQDEAALYIGLFALLSILLLVISGLLYVLGLGLTCSLSVLAGFLCQYRAYIKSSSKLKPAALEPIIHYAEHPIFVVESQTGDILFHNQCAQRHYPHLMQNLRNILQGYEDFMKLCISNERNIYQAQVQFHNKELRLTMRGMFPPDSNCVIVVGFDITGYKHMMAALEKKNRELESINTLVAQEKKNLEAYIEVVASFCAENEREVIMNALNQETRAVLHQILTNMKRVKKLLYSHGDSKHANSILNENLDLAHNYLEEIRAKVRELSRG